jgi:DNA polymerase eta
MALLTSGNLGGKFGAEVASMFDTDQVSDLLNYSADQLRSKLGQEQGSWVYNACRGIDYSEINPRTKIKSMLSYSAPRLHPLISRAKNFQPALNTSEAAARWLRVLTADLASRVNEDEDHRLPKTITIHHRHGGITKSRQAPLPVSKEMGNEFLYNHALSLWRGIETEGRAFPTNNISVALSGFGEVEDKVQGIQGFLVPGVQSAHTMSGGTVGQNHSEVLGKRKREDEGIGKFFSRKEESATPPNEDMEAENQEAVVEAGGDEMDEAETYMCERCHKRILWHEMEEHDDYHVALELSKGPLIRPPPPPQLKTKSSSKEEKKGPRKKSKPVEKGQKRLEFGT